MFKPPATILAPLKDYCLNCEQHKLIKTNATLNNRIGYICVECYNGYIWAKELELNLKIDRECYPYLIQKVISGKKEDNQHSTPILKLVSSQE